MGIDYTFYFDSKNDSEIFQQIEILHENLVFIRDTIEFNGDLKLYSEADFEKVYNFVQQMQKDVSDNLRLTFQHEGSIESTRGIKQYAEKLLLLEKEKFIENYAVIMNQFSSKSFHRSVHFYYYRDKWPKDWVVPECNEWILKNRPIGSFVLDFRLFPPFGQDPIITYEKMSEIKPLLQELFAKLNLSFSIENQEENGRKQFSIHKTENDELFFPGVTIRDSTGTFSFFIKKKTPSHYFEQILNLSFLDITKLSVNYSGNFQKISEKIIESIKKGYLPTNEKYLPWPHKLSIVANSYGKCAPLPREKAIKFLQKALIPNGYLNFYIVCNIPNKFREEYLIQEKELLQGNIQLCYNDGKLNLSFTMRGYEDLTNFFQEKLKIPVRETEVG